MSVQINQNKCIGCGRCAAICPGNIIRQDGEKKAYLKFPESCWSCLCCMKECPVQAISLSLPLEAGGRGSRLTVRKQGYVTEWDIRTWDGREETLFTDTREANRY